MIGINNYLFFAAVFAFVWLILHSSTREYLTSQEKKIVKQVNSGVNKLKKIVRKYERTGKLTKENVGAFRKQYIKFLKIGMNAQAKGIKEEDVITNTNMRELGKMKGTAALVKAATRSGNVNSFAENNIINKFDKLSN
jgi:hypothetical protein